MSSFFSWLIHSVYPDAKIAPRPKRNSGDKPLPPIPNDPEGAVSTLDASIERARAKLEAKEQKDSAPGRKELLQQAMAIHRSQQAVFAGLTEEERNKLTVMAIETLIKPMAKGKK
jgi:hypothetical protein